MEGRFTIICILTLFVFSCQTKEKSEVNPQRTGSMDEFIRIPTTNGEIDKDKMAAISFEHIEYSFDTIEASEEITHTFPFTNTGKKDLLIADVTSTCGCTVPYYPDQPIAVGEGGEIKVVFDAEGKSGYQEKKISIFANTYPNETQLSIKGFVINKIDE